MLKPSWPTRTDCVALVCAGLSAWWLFSGADCIGGQYQPRSYDHYINQTHIFACFGGFPVSVSRRLGHFIVRYHDFIFSATTAAATIAIAWFTATIFWINKSQLAHSHQVERAYLSGGGGASPITQDTVVTYKRDGATIVLSKKVIGGIFQLQINNQGKTPGELHSVGIGFCDAAVRIGDTPYYEISHFPDWIGPGTQSRGIENFAIPSGLESPVVYGRFYYRDIFGCEHSSGFVLEITYMGTRPILAPKAYTKYD